MRALPPTLRSLVAAALMLLGSRVSAQSAELPLQLRWDAPVECASASEVRAELQRIAGAPVGEALQPLVARVEVTRGGGKYSARLHTEHAGQTGERSLQAEDCPTLVRSVTLVLALAFGRGEERASEGASGAGSSSGAGGAGTTASVGATRGEGASATSDATEPAGEEPRAEATRREEPNTSIEGFGLSSEDDDEPGGGPSFGLIFGGGAQLTLLPVVAPLLTGGVSLAWSDVLSLELRGSALPATSTTFRGASARFDGLLATLLGCAHSGVLGLCAGARVGALRGQARGVSRSGSRTAPWYALVLAPSLTWPARSAVQVGLEGALALSLYQPRFVVLGLGQTHRVPLLATDVSVLLRITP